MPLVRKCAGQLVGQRTIENVNFVAVSDQVEPVGPMPGLSGAARIRTTKGSVAANKVRPGGLVQMHDGDIAQVRWCGSVDLPARGQFQPLRVRAPYFGATHDVYVAAEQRMLFSGSEVEYLFGEESVARLGATFDRPRIGSACPAGSDYAVSPFPIGSPRYHVRFGRSN